MGWIIAAAIGILIVLIILNSNIIILNKNFITFHKKFIDYINAIINFLNNGLNIIKGADLDHGDPKGQVAAPILIAEHVNFIQRYRLIKGDVSIDDTTEILDLSMFKKYNLIMLEIWITQNFLKTIINETDKELDIQEQELLKYVPPVACADADILAYVDNDGTMAFTANYNSELIIIDTMEDDEDDYSE